MSNLRKSFSNVFSGRGAASPPAAESEKPIFDPYTGEPKNEAARIIRSKKKPKKKPDPEEEAAKQLLLTGEHDLSTSEPEPPQSLSTSEPTLPTEDPDYHPRSDTGDWGDDDINVEDPGIPATTFMDVAEVQEPATGVPLRTSVAQLAAYPTEEISQGQARDIYNKAKKEREQLEKGEEEEEEETGVGVGVSSPIAEQSGYNTDDGEETNPGYNTDDGGEEEAPREVVAQPVAPAAPPASSTIEPEYVEAMSVEVKNMETDKLVHRCY
jgi:hypothetical protein